MFVNENARKSENLYTRKCKVYHMTTIKIMKHNKNMIKSSTESYDEVVNQLINDFSDDMPVVNLIETPVSTIRLKEDTVKLLDSLRITPYESYESVIVRLLLAKSLNSKSD